MKTLLYRTDPDGSFVVSPKSYFDLYRCVPDTTYCNEDEEGECEYLEEDRDVFEANEILRASGLCGEVAESAYEPEPGVQMATIIAHMSACGWQMVPFDFHAAMHGNRP